MKYLTIIVLGILPVMLHGQIEDFDLEKYKLNVKQPDEFMQRFNGEIDKEGNSFNWPLSLIHRQSYILSLFDKELIGKAIEDDSLKLTIERFIMFVSQGNKYLRFTSPNWYAQARCSALYMDKPAEITYTLGTHTDTSRVSKWNIIGAKADFLNQSSNMAVKDSVLSPISQNLNFTKLSMVLNKPENEPLNFAYSNFKQNDLSIALFLSSAQYLKLNLVEELIFHFLDFEGWVFTVQNFNRDDDNAGWLISDLRQVTEQEKTNYRNDILRLDSGYQRILKGFSFK